jgi:hypothetical protein
MQKIGELGASLVGHNNPPEPTPFELSAKSIDDLRGEALLWLDGADVETQDQADGIANLIRMFRSERDTADERRKAINEPWRALIRENDGRWKPYTDACDISIDTLKRALLPWSQKLRDEQRAIREAAEQAMRLAEDERRLAAATANPVILADMQALAETESVALRARAEAQDARSARPVSGTAGLPGKRVGLRQKPVPVITDRKACMTHYWSARKEEVVAFLLTLANEDVRLRKHVDNPIPGVRVDMVDIIA